MTPQDIINRINDYEVLLSHADCRLYRIIPHAVVTRITMRANNKNLEIHYRKDWNDDLDDYEIELPVEFLLAKIGEEFDAFVDKYFEEKRKKEREAKEKYAKEKEEKEQAEYERLKKKFENAEGRDFTDDDSEDFSDETENC